MPHLRDRAATFTWALLFVVGAVLTLVPLMSATPGAIAQPAPRHQALQFATSGGSFGVAAHRGVPSVAPENTLASVAHALRQGVDFLEIDLQLTADGVPVLMHDRTVDRTTNGQGAVANLSLAEVRGLDAGGWFGDEFTGETVPTFDEFIEVVAPTSQAVFIELKGEWSTDEARLITDSVAAHHMTDRTAILAFSADTLRAVKVADESIARVWLVRKIDHLTLSRVAELGVNGVGARLLMFERYPQATKQFDSIGVVSLAYTLNEPQSWARARLLGIDIVATDRAPIVQGWLRD